MLFAAVCMTLATLCGCTHKEDLPSVNTSEITEISSTTARTGGSILTNGAEVTVRGVCYSSSNSNPTINDLHTTDGSGTGNFVSLLEGLQPQTRYYVRAYAMNGSGVAYGETVSFSTLSVEPNPNLTPIEMLCIPNGWKLTKAISTPAYQNLSGEYYSNLIDLMHDFEAAYILIFNDNHDQFVKPGAVVAPDASMGYTTLTNLEFHWSFNNDDNPSSIQMTTWPYFHFLNYTSNNYRYYYGVIPPVQILSLTNAEFIISFNIEVYCESNPLAEPYFFDVLNTYNFELTFVPA